MYSCIPAFLAYPSTLLSTARNRLSSYLDLFEAQVAAHNACEGDHMCLVGVWNTADTITGLLAPLVKAIW